MRLLIDSGVDVNTPAESGYTYLHLALELETNRAEIVEALLQAGADPNVSGICGRNALHHAAKFGANDTLKTLISHGAEVNSRTTIDDETTPLMEAAKYGHSETVQFLLQHGADPSIADINGMTANDYSIARQKKESDSK